VKKLGKLTIGANNKSNLEDKIQETSKPKESLNDELTSKTSEESEPEKILKIEEIHKANEIPDFTSLFPNLPLTFPSLSSLKLTSIPAISPPYLKLRPTGQRRPISSRQSLPSTKISPSSGPSNSFTIASPFTSRILSASYLTKSKALKQVLELKLSTGGWDWIAGDSIGVICENSFEACQFILDRLGPEESRNGPSILHRDDILVMECDAKHAEGKNQREFSTDKKREESM